MANIGIFNGVPSAGGVDGQLVTALNPIAGPDFFTGADTTGSPVKLAVRVLQSGYKRSGAFTIELVGATADRWALALDNAGSPGAWGAWGASLTLPGPIVPANTIVWARSRALAGENAGDDVLVSCRMPDDVTAAAPVGASWVIPYAVGAIAFVGKSWQLPYAIRSTVGKSWALPSTVLSSVGRSWSLPYSINDIAFPAVDGNTVLQYRFREGSGTSLADSGANGRTGTITTGSGAWGTTSPKNSLLTPYWDNHPTSSRINVPAAASVARNAGSFEAVIKTDAIGTIQLVHVERVAGAGYFFVWITAAGKLYMQAWQAGPSWNGITGGTTLATNTWYHLAATWDASGQKLYVNGVEDATNASNGICDNASAMDQVYLGGRTENDLNLDGKIAYAELSSAKRSGASILARAQLLGF